MSMGSGFEPRRRAILPAPMRGARLLAALSIGIAVTGIAACGDTATHAGTSAPSSSVGDTRGEAPDPADGVSPRPEWTLAWQDEFDGPDIDTKTWTHQIGGHGWGNRELQFYTDRPINAYIEDGHLVIQALRETREGNPYTSARLTSRDKVEFAFGRVEARIRVPRGNGLWPAFWMLGADFPEIGWPQSGEIDIMENVGSEPAVVHGTVHGPGYSGRGGIGGRHELPAGRYYADDFHVFALEWQEDDRLFFRLTPEDVPGDWVFNQPFFLMLNLAVGGKWPGAPDEETSFPQRLTVDYVRVYRAKVSFPAPP